MSSQSLQASMLGRWNAAPICSDQGGISRPWRTLAARAFLAGVVVIATAAAMIAVPAQAQTRNDVYRDSLHICPATVRYVQQMLQLGQVDRRYRRSSAELQRSARDMIQRFARQRNYTAAEENRLFGHCADLMAAVNRSQGAHPRRPRR